MSINNHTSSNNTAEPRTSWQEKAWEELLKKKWKKGLEYAEYTKEDLNPILSKYTKSGQGEIRIFHSSANKVRILKQMDLTFMPKTRSSWVIIERPKDLIFEPPKNIENFSVRNELTDGMRVGIQDTYKKNSNPGETTLLAIANYTGIIADFYQLDNIGTLFTGGRQNARVILHGSKQVDISKSQIEIDGGFEWAHSAVIVEMKSSFEQSDFNVKQALFPMLKWKKLLANKKVYSMVLLAETTEVRPEQNDKNKEPKQQIEYRAYDLVPDDSKSPIGMRITKSKKYIVQIPA